MRSSRHTGPASASAAGVTGRFAGAPGRVRIIGGLFKRTPIALPAVDGLRPTPDRVRETLFNWIGHLRPDLSGTVGLDLFAGSGVLGFELLSRGAAAVTVVERDARLVANLRLLSSRLRTEDRARILQGDALQVLSGSTDFFDLAFVDPPYGAGLVEPSLRLLGRRLAPGALVYVETDRPLPADELLGLGYEDVRSMKAGRVCALLLRRLPDAQPEAGKAAGGHGSMGDG
jgi:16S rRNA (guanine(966)-N(2))-methyltransferase RsmD